MTSRPLVTGAVTFVTPRVSTAHGSSVADRESPHGPATCAGPPISAGAPSKSPARRIAVRPRLVRRHRFRLERNRRPHHSISLSWQRAGLTAASRYVLL